MASITENKVVAAQQSLPPNLIPAEFVAMGKKRIAELVDLQAELLETLQEANRNWFSRLQSEAKLASELVTRVTAARSIPETAAAFQGWTNRHIEMATADARRLMADTQKVMATGTRLWSNGWLPNGWGGTNGQAERQGR